MLMLKQWLRAWRGGELGLLCIALSLAVASVSGIAGFSERLQATMATQSRTFLAADHVLTSPRPIEPQWLDNARSEGLRTAQLVAFRTMVYASEEMLLVSMRAASVSYPLRGELRAAKQMFADGEGVEHGPLAGEVWLDSRAMATLGITLGQTVEVGEKALVATRVLVDEPDRSSALNIYGPRGLMNLEDLGATEVVQPGSVVDYRYLFAGDDAAFAAYRQTLSASLLPGQKWLNIEDNQPALASALARAEEYLLLAASLTLALAGAAIALAAQRYGQRNIDAVALMKTLGASRRYILLHYLRQLLLVLLLASVLGGLVGVAVQYLLFASLSDLVSATPPSGSLRPLWMAIVSAALCLLCFAMPPIVRLSRVSPVHVLRRDESLAGGVRLATAAGAAGLGLLMYWYSGDLSLVVALMLGCSVLLVAAAGVVLMALTAIRRLSRRLPGSAQRLAVSSIYRRRYANAFQTASIALALMVLVSLLLLRELLLKDWQQQVAEDTPNYFLINIADRDVEPLEAFLADRRIHHAGLYPMVRGRLVEIDNTPLQDIEGLETRNTGVDRELNLSWSEALPEDNQLIAGQWWSQAAQPLQTNPVSVEQELAQRLNITVGTALRFNVGGRDLTATVASLRQLDWASMRPNFYFLFPEDALRSYAGSYITSFYLDDSQRPLLVDLLGRYPTVSLIEIGEVLKQVQGVVAQLSRALAVVLLLVLVSALLISAANVMLSFQTRNQENALLRTLGARNRFLFVVVIGEFALLGALAGAVAGLGANFCLFFIQRWVMQSEVLLYWAAIPLASVAGAGILALLVLTSSRKMLRSSATVLLRGA